MLIYYKQPETEHLMVAQVSTGGPRGTGGEAFQKKLEDIHEKARGIVGRMEDGQIVVTGDATVTGDGRFLDNHYTSITGIKSNHPEIFTPLNPNFTPGREHLDRKRQDERLSFIGKQRQERHSLIQGGISPADLEVKEIEWEKREDEYELSLKEKYDKLISNLKSYKEQGLIVKPTRVEEYGDGQDNPRYLNFISSKKHTGYESKYAPGDHHSAAYDALKTKYAVVGKDENGSAWGVGALSKNQVKRLKEYGLEAKDNAFTVSIADYDALSGEYMAEKDAYIKANNLCEEKTITSTLEQDDIHTNVFEDIKPK